MSYQNPLEEINLKGPDAIFNSSTSILIEDCQQKGIPDDVVANALIKDFIGAPSAIRLINEFKSTIGLPSTDSYLKKAFKTLLEKKLGESFVLSFDEFNTPKWFDDCLAEEFYCDLFSELGGTHSSNSFISMATKKIFLKKKADEAKAAQETDLLREITKEIYELSSMDKEEFEDNLPLYIKNWLSSPLKYLFAQLIMHGTNKLEILQYLRISRELEDAALTDPSKHSLVQGVSNLLNPLPDEEFAKRLFNALSKSNFGSVPILRNIHSKCTGKPSNFETRALINSNLVEKLIHHTFLTVNPSGEGLNDDKERVLEILAFIRTASFTEGGSVPSVRLVAFKKLKELYEQFSLPFNTFLTKTDSFLKNSLHSYIFLKYVQHYIKDIQYYEQTFFRDSPKLHNIIFEVANLHSSLRSDAVVCLFECLKAPSNSAFMRTETQVVFKKIINTILKFLILGEERLVFKLFAQNTKSVNDDYTAHAFEKLLKLVKPPFSNSFAVWVCEWLIEISSHNRVMVLRSPPIIRFLVKTSSNLKPTTRYPIFSRDVQPLIDEIHIKQT